MNVSEKQASDDRRSPVPLGHRVREGARAYVDRLAEVDLFEIGAAMTLLMVVISLHEPFWYLKLGIATLAVAALVLRPLMRSPLVWFGLVIVFLWSFTFSWAEQNNHDYLKVYWCLAVGMSLLAAGAERALRFNARVLIGLCFFFATLWKLVSPDYLDGSFFNYFLLQDSRFGLFAEHLGGLDGGVLASDQVMRGAHSLFGDPAEPIPTPLAPAVVWIAHFMTWWTVAIEGTVAAAFLLPRRFFLARWRDLVLFAFVLSTYVIAPILYFAWILLAMGVVQCEHERFRYAPLGYAVLFLFVLMRFYIPA